MKMLGGEEKTGRVGRGPVLLSPAPAFPMATSVHVLTN